MVEEVCLVGRQLVSGEGRIDHALLKDIEHIADERGEIQPFSGPIGQLCFGNLQRAVIAVELIVFSARKSQKARLRDQIAKTGNKLTGYLRERYGKSREIRWLNGTAFLPLSAVQHRNPMNFKGSVNSYTEDGRKEIHRSLEKIDLSVLRSLMETPEPGSAVYNDNHLAVYCAQQGNCAISGKPLAADEVRFLCLQGKTDYRSIVMVHWLYLPMLTTERPSQLTVPLSEQERTKVNKLRSKQGLGTL